MKCANVKAIEISIIKKTYSILDKTLVTILDIVLKIYQ